VSGTATPTSPIAEYALTLPTYRSDGSGAAVDRTAAQSEIVAQFLVLSRDGNGLGNSLNNPSMFKSVLFAGTYPGIPNLAGDAINAEGGKITSASGVLSPGVIPLGWTQAINILNSTQLNKFNIELDTGTGQVSKLTLGEKWEGMSLVPANDPANPDDYFLFIANDNDFLTSSGKMIGPDGSLISYNGFDNSFAPYPANRIPAAVGDATDPTNNENDTMFLAYRITIVPEPASAGFIVSVVAMHALARRRARRAGPRTDKV
jgi:hypothetical protein